MEQTTKLAEERLINGFNACSLKVKCPSIEYRLPDGTRAVYEPQPNPENPDEYELVGAYPDFVVLNLAAERDYLRSEVDQAQAEIRILKEEISKIMRETYDLKRLVDYWSGIHEQRVSAGQQVLLGGGGKPFMF